MSPRVVVYSLLKAATYASSSSNKSKPRVGVVVVPIPVAAVLASQDEEAKSTPSLCVTACSSQYDQKTDLMEETSQYIYTQHSPSWLPQAETLNQKWAAILLFYIAPAGS